MHDHHASGHAGVMANASIEKPSRVKTIAAWVLSALLALTFLAAGGSKLAAAPYQVQLFAMLGFPGWFMYVTGIIEIAGAIALLIPRYAAAGAVIIICVMLGALASVLVHAQMSLIPGTVVMLALAVAIGYLRSWSFPFKA